MVLSIMWFCLWPLCSMQRFPVRDSGAGRRSGAGKVHTKEI